MNNPTDLHILQPGPNFNNGVYVTYDVNTVTNNNSLSWTKAAMYWPLVIACFLPLHIGNSMSGAGGLGYQKGVPQCLIDSSDRI